MLDSLPEDLVKIVLSYATHPSLLTYRSINPATYNTATLAIFEGETQALRTQQLELLQHWLVTGDKFLTRFLHQHQDEIVNILMRRYQKTGTDYHQRLIYLFSLRKLLEPEFEIPKKQILMGLTIQPLDQADVNFLKLAYQIDPEQIKSSHLADDFSTLIRVKDSCREKLEINEAFIDSCARTLCNMHSEFLWENEINKTLGAFKIILPRLSADNKKLLSAKISATNRRTETCIHLILNPEQTSEASVEWLLNHIGSYDPFLPIIIDTLTLPQKERVLQKVASFNYDYWNQECQADYTKDIFYILLKSVSEDKRVDIFLNIIKQDFKSAAGYEEYLPRYCERFFDKLITQPESFHKILTELLQLPETNEHEAMHRILVTYTVFMTLPEAIFHEFYSSANDRLDFHPIVIRRFRDGKTDNNLQDSIMLYRELPHTSNTSLSLNTLQFIPQLTLDEDRHLIIDKHFEQLQIERDTSNYLTYLIPYQRYFSPSQTEKLITALRCSPFTWNFAPILFAHYSSFTTDFKATVSRFFLSESSYVCSVFNPVSHQIVNAFLENPELCTRDNLTTLASKFPKNSLAAELLDSAQALGEQLYKWPQNNANAQLKM